MRRGETGGGGEVVRLETAMRLDPATVRDTLAYIRDDLRGVRGYERVAEALGTAIAEIEARTPRCDDDRSTGGGDGAAWWPRWR